MSSPAPAARYPSPGEQDADVAAVVADEDAVVAEMAAALGEGNEVIFPRSRRKPWRSLERPRYLGSYDMFPGERLLQFPASLEVEDTPSQAVHSGK
jgi:hypothetical protein